MSPRNFKQRILSASALAALALVTTACRQDMHDQPKYKANGESKFFADHRNNRQLVPGTVARGHLDEDDHYYRGRVDGKLADTFPIAITAEVLTRGRQRYSIYCQPCHSPMGDGNGIAVQRGMKRPPSYHIERLQKASPGYIFDVITNGFATMYSYAERIPVADRWAIVAYVQALQLSQNTSAKDLTADEQKLLAQSTAPAATEAAPHSGSETTPAGGHTGKKD
jgi:mono/diheme cytochrome c family protein